MTVNSNDTMAAETGRTTEGATLEVDRGFVENDSSYGTDGASELTSLNSSITAYVRSQISNA